MSRKPLSSLRSSSRQEFVIVLGVAALAVAAYANSLRNGFVWDDSIVLSRQLIVFESAVDVLLPPAGIPQFSPDYYRPVTIASYLLDRALGGGRPFAFHLSVVLAHAATSALLYLLALHLLSGARGGRGGALLAAALFAVHPVHTESVAWMAGRSDVLATVFLLAALLAHRSALSEAKRALVVGVLSLLAFCSKETAIVLLPLLCLHDVLVGTKDRSRGAPRDLRRAVRSYAGPLGAMLVYVVLRHLALGSVAGHAVGGESVMPSPTDLVAAVGGYFQKLVWPLGLNAYIDRVPQSVAAVTVGVALLLTVAACTVRWWTRGRSLATFAVLWLGLALAPSLSVVWKIPDAPMAERYLYLPSVGLCLLVGYGAALCSSRRSGMLAAAAVGGVALIGGFAGTVNRNRVWHDNIRLWSDTVSKSAISGMPLRSLGTAYLRAGRTVEARQAFERALKRRNGPGGRQNIYNNLGSLQMGEGDLDAAERSYRHALQIDPNRADVLFNLGLVVFHKGGSTRDAAGAALEFFRRAQALSPHDPDIHVALGQALAALGERAAAVRHLRRALDLGVNPVTGKSVREFLAGLSGSTAKP